MYVTCKCLNVTIKTKGDALNSCIDDVELNIKEQAEKYFNNKVVVVKDLDNVKKELPGLVEVRNVDAWTVYRCYNCSTYTHAVRRDYGAALINANIITSEEEVNNLKASTSYSPVFRIVIDQNKVQELELEPAQTSLRCSVSQLPNNSREALATLEQQLEKAICQEAHLIDKKILEFTKQQYEILEKFKERAHCEHNFLARLICTESKCWTVNDSLNTVEALDAAFQQKNKRTLKSDVDARTPTAAAAAAIPNKNSVHQQHSAIHNSVHLNGSSSSKRKDANSYDGEPLFLLEGMDESMTSRHAAPAISDQESDTDDSSNEAIHTPRSHRGGHPTLAKSLPVTVPTFNHSFNQHSAMLQDDDEEQISRDPMDPHNIQASIKALAKSVHGDTVFGDLPRPRFSTQI